MKLLNQMKTQVQSQAGFTFIEVMIAISIFSIGVLGLMTSTHTVSHNQRNADFVTEATLVASDRLEEIKRKATNEPVGGSFGFDYFVDDQAGGFLDLTKTPTAWTAPNDNQREISEGNTDDPNILPGFTRKTTVSVYPTSVWGSQDFIDPTNIRMVEVVVDVSWTGTTGQQKSLQLNSVLYRRQFIQ
jgi:prepilin-type N-terminal cleavage/methylation domain-containing protein